MTMQNDLVALATIKAKIEALDSEKSEVEMRLVEAMTAKSQKSISAQDGAVKGTLVAATRVTIDSDKLKKALGPRMWDKVTTKVLDKEKLEAHVVTGDIDANVVASVSEEKPTKPYVKVSGKPVGNGAKKRAVRPKPRS